MNRTDKLNEISKEIESYNKSFLRVNSTWSEEFLFVIIKILFLCADKYIRGDK